MAADKEQGKILIIDDEEMIRMILSRKLSNSGYECVTADNGDQALEQLDGQTIGLAIMDINMPGKSGIDLIPEIKTASPDTQIIMATAITDLDTAVKCIQLGAYDYLTKPFNLDEVTLSVGRALEKRRLELENRDYRHNLENKVIQQSEKIRLSFMNAVVALANAIEAKDQYTGGHSKRVSDIATAIAVTMGLPAETCEQINLAGTVHDVGKIGISSSILNKKGPLTDDEFRIIQTHCEIGENILVPIAGDEDMLRIVRGHHERYNGSGYPDGLQGDNIPLGSRIIAVADAYEAMTADRSYRKAMPENQVLQELEQGAGTHFDPEVVSAFLKCTPAVDEPAELKKPA